MNDNIMCVHGGISREIRGLDDIRALSRVEEIPKFGAVCDLVWSDPDDTVSEYRDSPRGRGCLFGKRALENVCIGLGMKRG